MINGFITVKPVFTQENLAALTQAAMADDHNLLCPTHTVLRDGVIIGSISAIAIPLVTIWAHSKLATPRNTVEIVNAARNIGRMKNNGNPICTICAPASPIRPLMEKMGFVKYGDTTIFVEAT